MVYTIDSRKPIDWTATGKKKICENVKNIINTIKYEAPYNRKMGIGDDIIDQPAPIAKQRFAMQAAEQIKLHEPRAKVQKNYSRNQCAGRHGSKGSDRN